MTFSECVSLTLVISKQCACAVLRVYCQLWPVRLCRIFPSYLIGGTIFRKIKLIERNVCFYFLYISFYETFLILGQGPSTLLAQGPHFNGRKNRGPHAFYEVKFAYYCWTYPLIFAYINIHGIHLFMVYWLFIIIYVFP